MPPRKSAAKQPAKRKAQDPADTAAPAEDVKKDDAAQVLPAPNALRGPVCRVLARHCAAVRPATVRLRFNPATDEGCAALLYPHELLSWRLSHSLPSPSSKAWFRGAPPRESPRSRMRLLGEDSRHCAAGSFRASHVPARRRCLTSCAGEQDADRAGLHSPPVQRLHPRRSIHLPDLVRIFYKKK